MLSERHRQRIWRELKEYRERALRAGRYGVGQHFGNIGMTTFNRVEEDERRQFKRVQEVIEDSHKPRTDRYMPVGGWKRVSK